jgi:hypothetical protein
MNASSREDECWEKEEKGGVGLMRRARLGNLCDFSQRLVSPYSDFRALRLDEGRKRLDDLTASQD